MEINTYRTAPSVCPPRRQHQPATLQEPRWPSGRCAREHLMTTEVKYTTALEMPVNTYRMPQRHASQPIPHPHCCRKLKIRKWKKFRRARNPNPTLHLSSPWPVTTLTELPHSLAAKFRPSVKGSHSPIWGSGSLHCIDTVPLYMQGAYCSHQLRWRILEPCTSTFSGVRSHAVQIYILRGYSVPSLGIGCLKFPEGVVASNSRFRWTLVLKFF